MPASLLSTSILTASILSALAATSPLHAQKNVTTDNYASLQGKPAIVSPSYPSDSQGETVYQPQEEDQKDQPVSAGLLLPPKLIKMVDVKCTRRMKKAHINGQITLLGVVTAKGQWIDPAVQGTPDPDAAQAVLQALSAYRFLPGTLDGKPVAERLRIEVNVFTDKAAMQKAVAAAGQPRP